MVRGILRVIKGGLLGFYCPACQRQHVVDNDCTHSLANQTVPLPQQP